MWSDMLNRWLSKKQDSASMKRHEPVGSACSFTDAEQREILLELVAETLAYKRHGSRTHASS
jgi:hypothetical protein